MQNGRADTELMCDGVKLVLASASPSRRALMEATGLSFETIPAGVDEVTIRQALSEGDETVEPVDVAEILARAKAEAVSRTHPGAWVVGADQVLTFEGEIFDKPANMDQARERLLAFRGKVHELHSCVALARDDACLWTFADTAHMHMRDYSPEFLGRYLAVAGDDILTSVGAYKLEAQGVHLFSEIQGDYFSILGLPLMPLLDHLRAEGVLLP